MGHACSKEPVHWVFISKPLSCWIFVGCCCLRICPAQGFQTDSSNFFARGRKNSLPAASAGPSLRSRLHSTALATLLSILRSNFWSEQRQDNVVRSSTAKLKTQLFHSSKVKGVSANAAADLKSIGLSTLAYISVFFTSVGRKL